MFKKNTAVTGFTLGLVSSTDGSDVTTGTPVGYYTLDGGTQTAIGDTTPVHEGNGQWSFDLTAGEMNGDLVGLTFTHSSAITAHFTIRTDTKIVSELQDITTAQVNTEVDTGISDAALATAASLSTAQTDLDTITDSDGVILGAAGVDLVWDEVLTGGTHNVATSAGRRLRQLSATIFSEGTAQSGGNNSIQLASGAVSIDDQFKRTKVILIGGTGIGQEAIVTSSIASTDTLTTTPAWLVNPDATTEYEVLPAQTHSTVRNGGYDNGSVYVDTVNGTTGTEQGVNGTTTNPCLNLTDAYAIAAEEKLTTFSIKPGSSVTLPSDSSDMQFVGAAYNLALNGQDIDNSAFNGASISGIGTAGSGNPPAFTLCGIGTVTLPPCNGVQCGFFGTFTIGTAGNFTFGASAGVFDIPFVIDYGSGLNSSSFYLQNYGGGDVEIQNAGAGTGTYKFEMNGAGDLTINANCSATTEVGLHGHINMTNSASGITINDDTRYDITTILSDSTAFQGADIPLILTDTAEIGTAGAGLTDLGGMSTGMKAEINVEALDVLVTDTFAELASIPGATASLKDKISFICMVARNQLEQTSTTATLRADDGTTSVGTAAVSDDGTTAIRGEWG